MRRAFRRVTPVLVATLPVAATLAAQSNTGNVFGTVLDEHGSPISAATVTLTGPAAPRTSSTDAKGLFRILTVPPGRYALTVMAPGFTTFTREDVGVSVGKNTQVDASLMLAAVAESVTVKGETPLVDPRKVDTGRTFSGKQLTEIPTSRDVWALIQQIPGVQLDTVNVAGNASARISGPGLTSKGSGNVAYLVDGGTVTDNTWGDPLHRQNGGTDFYYDFNTIQDVEVVTGGSSLDQQNSGVTINVVTKRGTNQLKGSARYLYASANWQSANTPQQTVDLGLQTNSTRYIHEYGGDLGGPLLKDRLWLWASGSRQDISLNPATYDAGEVPYPQTTTLEPWSAKLNAQISNSNSAALYYLRSARLAYGLDAAPDRPPETRRNLEIPADLYKAEDSHVFSASLFASLFANYQDIHYNDTPVGGIDTDIAYYDDSNHNSWYYDHSKDPQKQVNLQVSRFLATGSISHELKFTFNYRQQIADSLFAAPGNQNITNEYSDFSYASLTRGVRRIFNTEYWTGALGDTLTAGNLTISLGVRYDLQQAKNLPSSSFANSMFAEPCTHCGLNGEGSFPGLPEVSYHGADKWQFRYTNWQPRVAATYAIGTKKETLLRASYARYADQLGFLAGALSGVPNANGYDYGWVDLNHDHTVQPNEVDFNNPVGYYGGVDPATLPAQPNTVQPGFKTPISTEITAGIDEQLTDDFAVSGTFSYRNTSHLQSTIPNGVTLSDYKFAGRATGVGHSLEGFDLPFDEPYFALDLPEPTNGSEYVNRPGATQRYYGLDISLYKRLSKNWTVRGNFGWNSFRQYLMPQSIQNPNNAGQNDNGGLATGPSTGWGYALFNASWQFNVSGLYQGPWGLTFGANFFGRQGYPNPSFVTVFIHDVNGTFQDLLIDQVSTRRYPNVYQLDLRLQKTFQIGPLSITPAAELFNATNRNTVLSSNQGVGLYYAENGRFDSDRSYGQIREVQSPRIVRLSVLLSF